MRRYTRGHRPITVTEKKLPRNCLGLSRLTQREIEIDMRQHKNEFDVLDTLIHESLHLAYPVLDELAVMDGADEIARVLWEQGYLRTFL